jgi:ankyrin repeat protein
LDAGADSTLRNKSGSTPFHLAVQNTGRGGTGMEKARAEQQKIIEEFLRLGISSSLQDGNGKSVLEWAKPQWIWSLLVGKERDRNAPEPIRKGRHT